MVALATVLMGTLAPLVLDALNMGKISVGPPYFDTVFVPIMLPLVVLLGIGPMVSWRSGDARPLVRKLRWLVVGSIILGLAIPLIAMGRTTLMVTAAVSIAAWAILSTAQYLKDRLEKNKGQKGLSAGVYGMVLAHMGIGVFVIGVALSSAFSIERDVHMKPGENLEINGFIFHLDSVTPSKGPNYNTFMGQVTVTKDGEEVAVLNPEKRTYFVQTMPMTEASIDSGLFRDLYVALADQRQGGGWDLRVYHKPFQVWIWLGPFMMALGGILAAIDRRYRTSAQRIVRARAKKPSGMIDAGARA